ncbi:TraB/GumN family protein [Candidatus Woesearchaeota archaeon]|nr:TraB/GumN family protein [Candidatus Woesearchaeota archaeon]
MKYKNLILLGSSHIAKESVAAIRRIIAEEKPDCVALELDKARYFALLNPAPRSISISLLFKVGVKGFLFSLIGSWAEKKLGKAVGVAPGVEMKEAIHEANKQKLKIALIDQPIEKTLQRLSQTITWKEKWRFVADAFSSIVLKKQEFSFDLNTVPNKDLIIKMMAHVRKRYPSLYLALISERNKFMARKLFHLMQKHPEWKILAIVGAGHTEGIHSLLSNPNVYIV